MIKIKLVLAFGVVCVLGCGNDDLSAAEDAKLKDQFKNPGPAKPLSSDQQKQFEEYMKKNMGGAPSAGGGASPAPPSAGAGSGSN
jgi:hypothetical protein